MDDFHYCAPGLDKQDASSGLLHCYGVHMPGLAIGMYDSSFPIEGVGIPEYNRDQQHMRSSHSDIDERAERAMGMHAAYQYAEKVANR